MQKNDFYPSTQFEWNGNHNFRYDAVITLSQWEW